MCTVTKKDIHENQNTKINNINKKKMNKEEFELTVKLTVEQQKQSDIIEKYLLDNHIDIYCRTKRTHIKEWVLNQNKDE